MTSTSRTTEPIGEQAIPVGLKERWLNFRNALIANPKFQRWAAKFPLTQLIAEKRSRQLFDICSGFVYSQVLAACVSLDLFNRLAKGPLDMDAIASQTGLQLAETERLIDAAVSLDLLEKLPGERIVLGQLGAAMVGNPAISHMVSHHHMLYADLADPVSLLRGEHRQTALGGYWGYGKKGAADGQPQVHAEDYSSLMSASQTFVAEDVLESYDFSKHHCLLDVGGGNGTFIDSVAQQHAELEFKLLDLPPIAAKAEEILQKSEFKHRIEVFGGNFFSQELPQGADVASLIRIVHDHDDQDVLTLFSNIREALPQNGTLVIAEPLAQKGGDPVTDAYFGFYFLAMGSGRARTFEKIKGMLIATGFSGIKQTQTRRPMLTGLITAQVSK